MPDARRWWESNPRALADLSHFECDLLRPLEYISRKFMFQTKLIISPPWVQVKEILRQKAQAPNQYLGSICPRLSLFGTVHLSLFS